MTSFAEPVATKTVGGSVVKLKDSRGNEVTLPIVNGSISTVGLGTVEIRTTFDQTVPAITCDVDCGGSGKRPGYFAYKTIPGKPARLHVGFLSMPRCDGRVVMYDVTDAIQKPNFQEVFGYIYALSMNEWNDEVDETEPVSVPPWALGDSHMDHVFALPDVNEEEEEEALPDVGYAMQLDLGPPEPEPEPEAPAAASSSSAARSSASVASRTTSTYDYDLVVASIGGSRTNRFMDVFVRDETFELPYFVQNNPFVLENRQYPLVIATTKSSIGFDKRVVLPCTLRSNDGDLHGCLTYVYVDKEQNYKLMVALDEGNPFFSLFTPPDYVTSFKLIFRRIFRNRDEKRTTGPRSDDPMELEMEDEPAAASAPPVATGTYKDSLVVATISGPRGNRFVKLTVGNGVDATSQTFEFHEFVKDNPFKLKNNSYPLVIASTKYWNSFKPSTVVLPCMLKSPDSTLDGCLAYMPRESEFKLMVGFKEDEGYFALYAISNLPSFHAIRRNTELTRENVRKHRKEL